MNKNARDWISQDNERLWPETYLDNHVFNTIFKIDSHQLDKGHPEHTPCTAFIHANDLANVIADLGTKSTDKINSLKQLPNTQFDPFPLCFFFKHNGKLFDRKAADIIHNTLTMEQMRPLALRPVQGFIMK